MNRRDMERVLEIEQHTDNPHVWSREDFITNLRQRNCVGMVAENNDWTINGFMVYELHKNKLFLLNMGVTPESRRQAIGAAMVGKLLGKLEVDRRHMLRTIVSDQNTSFHFFLRSVGLKAIDVYYGHFEPDDSAYVFSYDLLDDWFTQDHTMADTLR
ncbi:MAG: ribosomal-protein-alanine N-acetyltransferase RimI [Porticoccaceae bacterium]|nr:ribosomal-protein-alanine N-acetyltransferase RimI [Porticoccaceae bacterium]